MVSLMSIHVWTNVMEEMQIGATKPSFQPLQDLVESKSCTCDSKLYTTQILFRGERTLVIGYRILVQLGQLLFGLKLARQAYLIDNKVLAKELSVKGKLHNMHMKAAHGKAQESIYY
ncbi:Polyadenylate-binding protein-interacting protein 7 [Spatholobus suberectus]|nr:Polyadenylate-binding protein-interacting protein 7 [Spatholobus suberectus]